MISYTASDDMISGPSGALVSIEAAEESVRSFYADMWLCHPDLIARDALLIGELVTAIREAKAWTRPARLIVCGGFDRTYALALEGPGDRFKRLAEFDRVDQAWAAKRAAERLSIPLQAEKNVA